MREEDEETAKKAEGKETDANHERGEEEANESHERGEAEAKDTGESNARGDPGRSPRAHTAETVLRNAGPVTDDLTAEDIKHLLPLSEEFEGRIGRRKFKLPSREKESEPVIWWRCASRSLQVASLAVHTHLHEMSTAEFSARFQHLFDWLPNGRLCMCAWWSVEWSAFDWYSNIVHRLTLLLAYHACSHFSTQEVFSYLSGTRFSQSAVPSNRTPVQWQCFSRSASRYVGQTFSSVRCWVL
jgi:hypothetical protein